MRRIVDIVAVLTVLAIAAAWWMTRDTSTVDDSLNNARLEVDRIRAVVLLRSQSDKFLLNNQGWPGSIDPSWFGIDLPLNPLVDADRPWLEVAAPEQSGWEHPRPIFVVDRSSAMFWYNPALGIVRARVAMGATDQETVRVYNRVNKTSLTSIDPTEFGDVDRVDLSSIDIEPDLSKD